jgi:hypothetical protein
MKFIVYAVIAAVLAVTVPAWAQGGSPHPATPTQMSPPAPLMTPSTPPPPAMAPSMPETSAPPMHHDARAHRGMRHGPTSPTSTADQLNQQELARLQAGGAPMPPGAMSPPPGANGALNGS